MDPNVQDITAPTPELTPEERLSKTHETLTSRFSDIPEFNQFSNDLINDTAKRKKTYDVWVNMFPQDNVSYEDWQAGLGLKKKEAPSLIYPLSERSADSGSDPLFGTIPLLPSPRYSQRSDEELAKAMEDIDPALLQQQIADKGPIDKSPYQAYVDSKTTPFQLHTYGGMLTDDDVITPLSRLIYPKEYTSIDPDTQEEVVVSEFTAEEQVKINDAVSQFYLDQKRMMDEQKTIQDRFQSVWEAQMKQYDPEGYEEMIANREAMDELPEDWFERIPQFNYPVPPELEEIARWKEKILTDSNLQSEAKDIELRSYQSRIDEAMATNESLISQKADLDAKWLNATTSGTTEMAEAIKSQLNEVESLIAASNKELLALQQGMFISKGSLSQNEIQNLQIPGWLSYINSFYQGFGDMAMGTVKGAVLLNPEIQALSELQRMAGDTQTVTDYMLYKVNEAQDWVNNAWATNPMYREEFGHQLANGAGQMVGFMLGGEAGAALRLPGWLLPSAMGATQIGAVEYERAYDMTNDAHLMDKESFILKYATDPDEVIHTSAMYDELSAKDAHDVAFDAFLYNLPWGALEGITVGRFMGRFNKSFSGQVAEKMAAGYSTKLQNVWSNLNNYRAGRGFRFGAEEALQEMTTEMMTNITSAALYDKTRTTFENVARGGEIGGILGMTLGLFTPTLAKRMADSSLSQTEQIEVQTTQKYIEAQLAKLEGIDDLTVFDPVEYSDYVGAIKGTIISMEADIANPNVGDLAKKQLQEEVDAMYEELAYQQEVERDYQAQGDYLKYKAEVIIETMDELDVALGKGDLSPATAEVIKNNIVELADQLEVLHSAYQQHQESYAETIGRESETVSPEEVSGEPGEAERLRVRDVEEVGMETEAGEIVPQEGDVELLPSQEEVALTVKGLKEYMESDVPESLRPTENSRVYDNKTKVEDAADGKSKLVYFDDIFFDTIASNTDKEAVDKAIESAYEIFDELGGRDTGKMSDDELIISLLKTKEYQGININTNRIGQIYSSRLISEIVKRGIPEAYNKSKIDGSNPELVSAIDRLLGKQIQRKLQLPPSTDYVTDDGGYSVSKTNEGVQVVNNKTGAVVDARSANYQRVIGFYKQSNLENLRQGERVSLEPGMTEQEYRGRVVDVSNNPQEIAEEWLRSLADPAETNTIDDYISSHLGRITPQSFNSVGDPSYVTPAIRMQYFRSANNGGQGIDQVAQEIKEMYNPPGMDEGDVSQAIIDFIVAHPGGADTYLPTSPDTKMLSQRFNEVAGFRIDEEYARELAGVNDQASSISDELANTIVRDGITPENWDSIKSEAFWLTDSEIEQIQSYIDAQTESVQEPAESPEKAAQPEKGTGRVEDQATIKPQPVAKEASLEVQSAVEEFVSEHADKPYDNRFFGDWVRLNKPDVDIEAAKSYYEEVSKANEADTLARSKVRETLDATRDEIFNIVKPIDESQSAADAAAAQITESSIPVVEAWNAVRKGVAWLNKPVNAIQDRIFADQARNLEDWVSKKTKQGLTNSNAAARLFSRQLTGYFGGMPRSNADLKNKLDFNGEVNFAKENAREMMNSLWGMVNNDQKSLIRVHKVLDPEPYIAKGLEEGTIPTYDELSVAEKRLYDTLKKMNNYIHDYNYSMGLLKTEVYDKFKDKYIARMYETTTLPRQVEENLEKIMNTSFTGSGKVDLKMFKKRQEMTEELASDIIQDPVFLTTIRLMQTEQNAALLKYLDYIGTQEGMVSDVAAPGFVKLKGEGQFSNIPVYGSLTNKYVAHHIVEDLHGFFYADKALNGAYEFLKWYDRWLPRQFYKKWNTVFSPPVMLGNATSNIVFAQMAGIDVMNYVSSVPEAVKQVKNRTGDHYKIAVKRGLLGTNVISQDLRPLTNEGVERAKAMDESRVEVYTRAKDATVKWLGKTDKAFRDLYQGTDDVAKVAALRSLMEDYGYSEDEAVLKVYEAFQNYATVGKIWDVASKMPYVGPVYVKFQADLQRILKNAVLKRPLSTAAMVVMYRFIASAASAAMGEDEVERDIRENRKFIPEIPFPEFLGGNVPLTFMTGIGEINLARYISPFYIYDMGDAESPIEYWSKFLPYQIQVVEKEQKGTTGYLPGRGDVLLGPLADLIVGYDFRGLDPTDPTATRYTPSGITDQERYLNATNYLLRSYIPFYRSANDMYTTIKYGRDYYGRSRTMTQSIINQFIKIQDVRQSDYQDWAVKDIQHVEYQVSDVEDKIRGAEKNRKDEIKKAIMDFNNGSITQDQLVSIQEAANARFTGQLAAWTEELAALQEDWQNAVMKLQRLYEHQATK